MRKNPNAILIGSALSRPGVSSNGNGSSPKPGRKPKHNVAMTPAQRKANERERKRQAAEDRMLKQWQNSGQKKFDKENPVTRGRLHRESSHAPDNIEAIRHAQNQAALTGGYSPEELARISTELREAPTGGGKRERPEGYGDYKNSDYSGNESQIANPFSEVVTTKSGRKFNLREFVETHFREILYCAYPREIAVGPEGKDVPAWHCYLQCQLCPYESTPARLYSDLLIVRAKAHVRSYHLAEFQNWQPVSDELPAWIDPIREKQLRGETLKLECPVKAKHEEWRLKAKERYEEAINLMPHVLAIEKESNAADYDLVVFGRNLRERMKECIVCSTCRAPIFLPPEVAPKPDMKLLSHPKKDERTDITGIQDARLALRIAMNQCIDTCSPDPDEG
jgi:hypothetical protein